MEMMKMKMVKNEVAGLAFGFLGWEAEIEERENEN